MFEFRNKTRAVHKLKQTRRHREFIAQQPKPQSPNQSLADEGNDTSPYSPQPETASGASLSNLPLWADFWNAKTDGYSQVHWLHHSFVEENIPWNEAVNLIRTECRESHVSTIPIAATLEHIFRAVYNNSYTEPQLAKHFSEDDIRRIKELVEKLPAI